MGALKSCIPRGVNAPNANEGIFGIIDLTNSKTVF